MRWLKMAEQPPGGNGLRGGGSAAGAGDIQVAEEEDVFAGLEDLKEEDELDTRSHRSSAFNVGGSVGQQYGPLDCNHRSRPPCLGQ